MLQQNLGKYYEFESAEKVCTQFNNLINMIKKEQSLKTGEKYPCLDDTDERKYMDREILKIYKFRKHILDKKGKRRNYGYVI